VAASMAGRHRLARRALHRLQETPAGADPTVMADLWRRALTARLFSDQYDPRKAGADRNASLLQPLLRSALKTFDARRAALAGSSSIGQDELNRHRAVCLAAMGRMREAAAAWPDAPAAGPLPPARAEEPAPRRKAA
jgi:hypothetical protein